ncbi:MAG: hypothetical protein ABSA45_08090 [Verrucomicrobiota bacterium]
MKTRIVDRCKFTNQDPSMMPAARKIFSGSFAVVVWFLALAIFGLPANAAQVHLLSARNSLLPVPAGGNDNSIAPSLSPDGRFVVFTSAANDLTPGGNGYYCLNVFLRDRASNTTALVSGNLSGTGGGNGSSMFGQASTNGQFVVFQSDATNLVANDTNNVTDIFVRDLVAGTTTLVSASINGGPANGASTDPVITPDGHYVAFISRASNLVPGDTNGIADVFVRDLVAGTNDLVSVNALLPPNVSIALTVMATPVITPDGRYVAFFSLATNLVPTVPGTNAGDVYVRDRLAGTTIWASTNAGPIISAHFQFYPNIVTSYRPRLSDDGCYVAFKAVANSTNIAVLFEYNSTNATTAVINTNGVGGLVNLDEACGPEITPDGRYIAFVQHEGAANSGFSSVHVWDTWSNLDTLVSADSGGVPANTTSHTPNVSSDGRFVAFLSNASDLASNVVTTGFHVYLRDLQTNVIQLVDVDTNGAGSTYNFPTNDIVTASTTTLSLSADGRYVAFSAPDGRLTSLDNNRAEDVFVRDMVAGATDMVSQRIATGNPEAADGSSTLSPPSVSSDGRWVAFSSWADNLVLGDTNRSLDVFVRDVVNGTNILVSAATDGAPTTNGNSFNGVISADGRYVAFLSTVNDLFTNSSPFNLNSKANVFRRDLETGTTELVSVGTDGVSFGNGDASYPAISPDGRYVVFMSQASNLATNLTSGLNTYWRDMNLGRTVGLSSANASHVFSPTLSDNGRYVAYAFGGNAFSAWLQIWDTQLGRNIYTNTTLYLTSAAIDPTGTKILYWISTFPITTSTIYVDNIVTGTNLFSILSQASIRNAACWSDDGRWLAFLSTTNLGLGYDNTNRVYLRDFQIGTLSLVGIAGPATNGLPTTYDAPAVSGDGRFVAYRSIASNTVIGVNGAPPNLLLFDRLTGSNVVLTVGQAGSGPIPWVSRPVINYDGTLVAFLDLGSDLVSGDLNRMPDVFGASIDINAYLADSDSDGIPDWWMMKYFGHPTGQADDLSLAADDADGDGVSNLQEYLAGTDPTNPNSVFRLWAGVPAGGAMDLTWLAAPGMSYQVQYKTNLDDPVWLTAPGDVRQIGNQGYYLAPMVEPSGFYRVLGTNN